MLDHLCNKSKFRLLHMVEIEQCVSKDLTVFILCSTLHGCTLMLLLTDTSYRVGGGFSDLYTLPFLSTNCHGLSGGLPQKLSLPNFLKYKYRIPIFLPFHGLTITSRKQPFIVYPLGVLVLQPCQQHRTVYLFMYFTFTLVYISDINSH